MDKTLGNNIKRARKIKKLKQSELAEKTGLSTCFISYLETGLKDCSSRNLSEIAKVLEVSIDWLVYNKEE